MAKSCDMKWLGSQIHTNSPNKQLLHVAIERSVGQSPEDEHDNATIYTYIVNIFSATKNWLSCFFYVSATMNNSMVNFLYF